MRISPNSLSEDIRIDLVMYLKGTRAALSKTPEGKQKREAKKKKQI